jgi:hypothetical protein
MILPLQPGTRPPLSTFPDGRRLHMAEDDSNDTDALARMARAELRRRGKSDKEIDDGVSASAAQLNQGGEAGGQRLEPSR